MGYNTLPYLVIFLPVTLAIYQITKQEHRKYTLLIASWIYFYLCSGWLILYLIGTTVFIWLMGLAIGRCENQKRRMHLLLILGLIVLFGLLLFTKYTGFFSGMVNAWTSRMIGSNLIPKVSILVPIGISFYTLEAVGYLLEVYWGRIEADRSFVRLALFLSFFPQTMEGPIARYQDTAQQLTAGKPVITENVLRGCHRILWGLFKKIIIADRLNTVVSGIYSNDTQYSGIMIAVAAVSYTIQLYMEFSGVIDIVIGSGCMFGVKLPENFRQPFFAQNASEFWRRWHISLGTWLKTYLFYPVTTSGMTKSWNRFARKRFGKYISKVGTSFLALTPVWLFNGLWHGPQWNYIFYGIYYLCFLMLEVELEPAKKQFYGLLGHTGQETGWKLVRIIRTWFIIFTGELFFRADGFRQGARMFTGLFRNFGLQPLWNGTLGSLGLDRADWIIIACGTLVVFAADIVTERGTGIYDWIEKRCLPIRWTFKYGLILAVLVFGAYGIGYQQVDLIYAGF